jgi:GABA permease
MRNPLRSETEVFRAVVVIGAGAAVVVVLTLIAGSTAGATLFFLLLAAGLWVLWQRARGGEESDGTEVSATPLDVFRLLVIANQTVGGRALLDEIAALCAGKQSEVLVVTPALTASQLQHWTSDVDEALAAAKERLEASVAAIRGLGLEARGVVGDQDPNVALADGLREFGADQVVISTHPPERSRWLEQGVVEKAREAVPAPVTHLVVAETTPSTSSASRPVSPG